MTQIRSVTAPAAVNLAPGATLPIDLDAVDIRQLARTLQPHAAQPPRLLIDCARLRCLRTLGVSHVVSQLLVLHQAGAEIWLTNVTPLLRRCLGLLRLAHLFHAG